MSTCIKDLYDYLEKELNEGKCDFSLRVNYGRGMRKDGIIQFYIHPTDKNGQTIDFSLIKFTEDDYAMVLEGKTE